MPLTYNTNAPTYKDGALSAFVAATCCTFLGDVSISSACSFGCPCSPDLD